MLRFFFACHGQHAISQTPVTSARRIIAHPPLDLTRLYKSRTNLFLYIRLFDVDQHTVTSPARSAVQAALAAMAEAQTIADPATAESSAAAQDAIGMVQEALDRRESAAAELKAVASEETPPASEVDTPPPGKDVSSGSSGSGGGEETGIAVAVKESTKEPESARWSRNNPAASHSHMAHLLW